LTTIRTANPKTITTVIKPATPQMERLARARMRGLQPDFPADGAETPAAEGPQVGNGIIELSYLDDPYLRGVYSVFVQIERLGGGQLPMQRDWRWCDKCQR
jgi:hypothetical protein